ncbi:MAG: hypothetical protein FWE67_11065 [Planctomycetaceae bacterium]|nr:hypothetical protein [Planctomycetaceae bacterium]
MAAGDIRAGGAFVELYAADKKLVNGLRAASKRLDASGTVKRIFPRVFSFIVPYHVYET